MPRDILGAEGSSFAGAAVITCRAQGEQSGLGPSIGFALSPATSRVEDWGSSTVEAKMMNLKP